MSEKKLFISLLPYLKDKNGHFFVYEHCVREVIQSQNMAYISYVSRECTLPDMPLEWKRWFASAERPLGLFARLQRKYRDFSNAFRQTPFAGQRIFFLDVVYKLDLLALCMAIFLHGKSSDTLWLFFRHPLPPSPWNTVSLLSRILYKKLKKRLVSITDSERIKETFAYLPFSPNIWPIPHMRHLPAITTPSQQILCWWPGPPREEKGWGTMRSLTRINESHSRFFTVRAAKTSLLCSIDNGVKIDLINDNLSDEEYAHTMAECHFVLLPYDPELYHARTSGIFVEAVIAHKIPLVKARSWLAYELERFDLHELIIDWERPDLFEYLYALFQDGRLKRKLFSMQKSYAQFHNKAVFQEKLVELCKS